MFQIGDQLVDSTVLLAPMAGVTDLPFRRLCRQFGAGLTTSEMLTSDTRLWQSKKSSSRLVIDKQNYPISMQIAGSDPSQMADAAQRCVELGAQIVDINMGCPAKKVCKRLAGSALLSDEALVAEILKAVVSAVSVPVTLKTRIGTDEANLNGLHIAKLAEDLGVKAIAMHGRTRACRFKGDARYDTIAELAHTLHIPVFANGDIDSAQKAESVLRQTGAQAVLIGRAALGKPWLFRDMCHYLKHGQMPEPLSLNAKHDVVHRHVSDLHEFYGAVQGVRIARKHFAWYSEALSAETLARSARGEFNKLDDAESQLSFINTYFQWLKFNEEKAA